MLFVAIDLLLRAVLGVVPGTTAIISLFGPPDGLGAGTHGHGMRFLRR